ncbi:cylicin-1-like [Linepithema humile]|uniref:cylicin-1-like n=1 Tax=Linepithema humile TaxID=83485 RepID=UPI00351EC210
MLPDKMAISRSNHLFVRVAFVFCLLSLLVHVSNSHDYTESRQFKKKHAVSRYRNNTQRLPNYNWKPPDKYGPRKESTEKKVGMEFTKPEDPEQRVADPWIKKMQEISRQEREKWAAYKRNENGKLALDNVEETTKASKLTNDESITILTLSKSEEYENVVEKSNFSGNVFEGSDESLELDPAISKPLAQHSSEQNTAGVKNFLHKRHKDYLILEVIDPTDKKNDDEESELEEDRLFSAINSHSAESISQESKNKHIPTNTRRNFFNFPKNYSEIYQKFIQKFSKNLHNKNSSKQVAKEHPNESSSSGNDNAKESKENEQNNKINLLTQKIKKKKNNVNSYHSKPISEHSKNRRKTPVNTHENLKKLPKNNEKLNHRNGSEELSAKEHLKQSSPSRNDNEKSKKDSKGSGEKITTAKPLMRKSKEKEERKDTTEEPLNHEGSFHPGRWGMSISLPPAEFLKDMFLRSMYRKNKQQTEGEKGDRRQHVPGRWGMSVISPPKEFLEDIATHQGYGRLTMETRSRPGEVKGFSDDRSSVSQSRQNLQMDLVRATADERDKDFKVGRVPSGFYNFEYQRLNTWNNYADFNRDSFLLRKLKLLIQALQSDIIDIPIRCHMEIP